MINKDRIVPVEKIDLLSLYGLILSQSVEGLTKLEASNVEGDYEVSEAGTYLANAPVKSLTIAEGVDAVVYFVAAYDYSGDAEVEKDAVTLYKLEDGSITKVGF